MGIGRFSPCSFRRATYRLLIENLALGRREYREIKSAADQVGLDYSGRFLVELLQNASDAAHRAGLDDSLVRVIRTDSAIHVANQGAPFDPEGAESICSLALTTKDAATYVGNKGVGFKSVIDVTSAPEGAQQVAPLGAGQDVHDVHAVGRAGHRLSRSASTEAEQSVASIHAQCPAMRRPIVPVTQWSQSGTSNTCSLAGFAGPGRSAVLPGSAISRYRPSPGASPS
jgi:hypothetical protein